MAPTDIGKTIKRGANQQLTLLSSFRPCCPLFLSSDLPIPHGHLILPSPPDENAHLTLHSFFSLVIDHPLAHQDDPTSSVWPSVFFFQPFQWRGHTHRMAQATLSATINKCTLESSSASIALLPLENHVTSTSPANLQAPS